MELTEILKVLKEFRMETAGNFEMIKKEINELRQHTDKLKLRMDAAELRNKKQTEAKCEDLEGCDRRNNLRIYAVPERSEGNNIVEFVRTIIQEKLDTNEVIHIEHAHRTGPFTGRNKRPDQLLSVSKLQHKANGVPSCLIQEGHLCE